MAFPRETTPTPLEHNKRRRPGERAREKVTDTQKGYDRTCNMGMGGREAISEADGTG